MPDKPRNDYCPICAEVGGPSVHCVICDKRKPPPGRALGLITLGSWCNSDCLGYDQPPHPGHLWPGEVYGESLGHADWHDPHMRDAVKMSAPRSFERPPLKQIVFEYDDGLTLSLTGDDLRRWSDLITSALVIWGAATAGDAPELRPCWAVVVPYIKE